MGLEIEKFLMFPPFFPSLKRNQNRLYVSNTWHSPREATVYNNLAEAFAEKKNCPDSPTERQLYQ